MSRGKEEPDLKPQLLADIKKGEFHRTYLLYGPEAYVRRWYLHHLADAIVPETDTMNRTVFEGKDVDENEIISLADTVPFFAKRRLILIRDSGLFGRAERLAEYLAEAPDYLTILFDEEAADRRTRLFKAAEGAGLAVSFQALETKDLIRWVEKQMEKAGKVMRRADIETFLAGTGFDMNTVSRETDKLLSYTQGRDEVTAEDVAECTVRRAEERVFDMVGAVASHDKKTALRLYADLMETREPPMRILALLSRQYSQILHVKELSGTMNVREVTGALGFKSPWVTQKCLKYAASYSKRELLEILSACTQMEEDVKSGRLTDRLSVDLLLAKLA